MVRAIFSRPFILHHLPFVPQRLIPTPKHELISSLFVSIQRRHSSQYPHLKNVPLNHRDHLGKTCLHYAVHNCLTKDKEIKQKAFEVCQMYLLAGADPNIRDGNGFTALQHAIANKNERLIALLKIHGATL